MKRVCAALLILAGMAAGLLPGVAAAEEKPVVRTSAQPCLHGFPMWYAEKQGWLKDAPFTVKFMLFASGAPQTEAGYRIHGHGAHHDGQHALWLQTYRRIQ